MKIRKTEISDIPAVMKIYDAARAFMRNSGNLHQWTEGYPSESQLRNDIESGGSYVLVDENNKAIATFFFTMDGEPTYQVIRDGNWLDNEPYGVIHRVASDGSLRGVLHNVLDYCFGLTNNIRIDTHHDNKVMQNGLLNYGFRYCGIINLANGDERLAYQLHR